ncbi:MAG TPA: T9SS type B sorting domain-containing protein [Bacteroidia bacterium]|nr:T9SS type B sorting domain-containing protein [Bacteroidia bacterium]
MKRTITCLFIAFTNFCLVSYGQNIANIGFEDGTTSGWTCMYGTYGTNQSTTVTTNATSCSDVPCPLLLPNVGCLNSSGAINATNNPFDKTDNRHVIVNQSGNDPNSNNNSPYVAPANLFPSGVNRYSFRLGNAEAGGTGGKDDLATAEGIKFTYVVTAQTSSVTYLYSAYLLEASSIGSPHGIREAPRFEIKVVALDGGMETPIDCGYYNVIAGVNTNNFQSGATGIFGVWKYTPWTKVGMDLTAYIGKTVCIEFRTTDCFPGGNGSCSGGKCNCNGGSPGTHSGYAYIDMYSGPLEIIAPPVCGNQASAQLCGPPGYASYSWPAGQPGLTGSPNTQCVTINNPTPGTTYTVNMTSLAGGCPAKATVTLKGLDFEVRDTTVCPSTTPFPLVLTPTIPGNYNYEWSPPTGLSCTNCQSPNLTPSSTQTYTVTATDPSTGGCKKTKTVTVNVNASIKINVPPKTICLGDSAVLIATGAEKYTWSPATGLSSDTGAVVIANPKVTTTYTVTGSVSGGGCSGVTTVVVTVSTKGDISVESKSVCKGDTVTLTAKGALNYLWRPSTGLSDSIGATVKASPAITTTYSIIGLSKSGCLVTDTATVTVNPSPTLVTVSDSICEGESASLFVSGANTYTWEPSAWLDVSTGNHVISTPPDTWTYKVTGASSNGCKATKDVNVMVYPKALADFSSTPKPADIFHPLIHFTDLSTNATTWSWNFGDADSTFSNEQNPSFNYLPIPQQYLVTLIVSTEFGCKDTVTAPVVIEDIFTFYIPNTFTPNEDNYNDLFLPKGVGIDESDYQFLIFDRWGNLIWSTKIWGQGWNGVVKNHSEMAQIDTYVWKVSVKEKVNKKIHNYVGHVNIVK